MNEFVPIMKDLIIGALVIWGVVELKLHARDVKGWVESIQKQLGLVHQAAVQPPTVIMVPGPIAAPPAPTTPPPAPAPAPLPPVAVDPVQPPPAPPAPAPAAPPPAAAPVNPSGPLFLGWSNGAPQFAIGASTPCSVTPPAGWRGKLIIQGGLCTAAPPPPWCSYTINGVVSEFMGNFQQVELTNPTDGSGAPADLPPFIVQVEQYDKLPDGTKVPTTGCAVIIQLNHTP